MDIQITSILWSKQGGLFLNLSEIEINSMPPGFRILTLVYVMLEDVSIELTIKRINFTTPDHWREEFSPFSLKEK